MESYLNSLNPEQFDAVTSTEGYVRVIAGAGSGKTKALSARFAYLVQEMGILPAHILCVTFTNKAAEEMRRRIHNLTGDHDTGYVNTFHGFCVSVLQEESYAVGYPKSFLVLDNSDINELLRLIYEERNLNLRHMTFADARDMFEIRKCLTEPAYYLDLVDESPETVKKKYDEATEVKDILFYGYLYQQKKCFGLDYNDLIILTLHIFKTRPEIARKWQERLEYIMIDEFQDIDPLQLKLMDALQGYHKNLFIVGDPDQTIYTWRGANVKYILNFDKEYPGTKTIMMNTNYRSTPQIIAAVNSLIAKNRSRVAKDLKATCAPGPIVKANLCETPEDEAAWIAGEMQRLHEAGRPYREMTLLYRAHYLTRSIEEVMQKEEIPYTLYGGVGFFDRAEVKDALSYLRMIAYEDDLSFRRVVNVPKRNLGERRLRFLEEQAAAEGLSLYQTLKKYIRHDVFKGTGAEAFIELIDRFAASAPGQSISKLFNQLLHASGYEKMLRTEGAQDRLDNLAELKQIVLRYEISCGEECALPDFLAHIALYSENDRDEENDKVKLMTVHAAKGLEFPVVFLCGMNEGVFPGRRTDSFEQMEEERRLCFVAMSRAKEALYLSAVEGRLHDGAPRYMSRFLLDVEPGLIEYETEPREELIADTREYIALKDKLLEHEEQELFAIGTQVRHAVLGLGTVEDVDTKKKAYLVKFTDLDTPRAISFKAKLTAAEGAP
ncbi:MAG: UvrD-helicase domain-containing protein [Lachnospiraceae bacterium]|nr:UvrD-helicase domain-containing protein [Lachnospiraceae bacterium]